MAGDGFGVRTAAVFGGMLVIGLVLGGWVLGSEIKDIKLADRYVTVRGLTERTVKADTALWRLDFKASGDDLAAVFAKSEQDKRLVLTFLSDAGVVAGEIVLGQANVVDRQANEYGGENKGPRYIVGQGILVESKDVDKISRAQQKTSGLVRSGVILTSNPGQSSVQYLFTGLNAVKPDMITEATRNARTAATRFAADSGSQVGNIRKAEQGAFSITSAEGDGVAAENGEGNGGGGANASVMKKVRVVTTVDYYLER